MREHGRRVVVEQYALGRDHRVLVVDGKVVACAERVPAHVTGDGRLTIREDRLDQRDVGVVFDTPATASASL